LLHRWASIVTLTKRLEETDGLELVPRRIVFSERDEDRNDTGGNVAKRRSLGDAGRRAVESFYNWDRVARDTRDFTLTAIAHSRQEN